MREDEAYMETEVAQGKVDRIKLKLALQEEQNNCEAINFNNANLSEALFDQMSVI